MPKANPEINKKDTGVETGRSKRNKG